MPRTRQRDDENDDDTPIRSRRPQTGRPLQPLLVVGGVVLVVVALFAFVWWPKGTNFFPLEAQQSNWTLGDAVVSLEKKGLRHGGFTLIKGEPLYEGVLTIHPSDKIEDVNTVVFVEKRPTIHDARQYAESCRSTYGLSTSWGLFVFYCPRSQNAATLIKAIEKAASN